MEKEQDWQGGRKNVEEASERVAKEESLEMEVGESTLSIEERATKEGETASSYIDAAESAPRNYSENLGLNDQESAKALETISFTERLAQLRVRSTEALRNFRTVLFAGTTAVMLHGATIENKSAEEKFYEDPAVAEQKVSPEVFAERAEQFDEKHHTKELVDDINKSLQQLSKEFLATGKVPNMEEAGVLVARSKDLIGAYPTVLARNFDDAHVSVDLNYGVLKILYATERIDKKTDDIKALHQSALGVALEISQKFAESHAHTVANALKTGDEETVVESARALRILTMGGATEYKEDSSRGPKYLEELLLLRQKMSKELIPLLKKIKGGKEEAALVRALASAGDMEAKQMIASLLLTEKNISAERFSEIVGDNSAIEDPYVSKTGERIGSTAEDISREVLHSLRLPDSILETWRGSSTTIDRELDEDAYMTSMQSNISSIIKLETERPGTTKELEEKWGVKFPGRYPEHILLEQATRKNERVSQGAIIAANHDHNGVFYDKDNRNAVEQVWAESKRNAIPLTIMEAADRGEASERLLDLVKKSGARLQFLGVQGHGSEDAVRFSPFGGLSSTLQDVVYPASLNSQVITSSFLGVGPNRSSLVLEEGAPVYFESCKTGKAGGIAQEISQHTTGKVVAPQESFHNIEKFTMMRDTKGKLNIDIKYRVYEAKKGWREVKEMEYAAGELKK